MYDSNIPLMRQGSVTDTMDESSETEAEFRVPSGRRLTLFYCHASTDPSLHPRYPPRTDVGARPAPRRFRGLFEQVNSIVFYTQVGALSDNTAVEGTIADFGVIGLGTEVLLSLPQVAGSSSEFELGLGTNFLRGFAAVEPTLDLRASIRTLPQISVYATFMGLAENSPIQPYAGVTFGFAELWNARGYDPEGNVFELTADTYEIGATGGLYMDWSALRGLYVDVGYRVRNFESLNWSTETIPANWPRSIDTSGWIVNVGWQFRIRD